MEDRTIGLFVNYGNKFITVTSSMGLLECYRMFLFKGSRNGTSDSLVCVIKTFTKGTRVPVGIWKRSKRFTASFNSSEI